MPEIVIPARNWSIALANAVQLAEAGTIIVVDSEAKAELARAVAGRLRKYVHVEVR